MTGVDRSVIPTAAQSHVAIVAADDDLQTIERSRKLAQEIGVPFLKAAPGSSGGVSLDVFLEVGGERLKLREVGARAAGPVTVDFGRGSAALHRVQSSSRKELLARAMGLKPNQRVSVLDATAGLCRDAFQMACWGFDVQAVERNPVMFALARDAIERGLHSPNQQIREALTRMRLVLSDAREIIRDFDPTKVPEVIYIDPMFPESGKHSAVKKEMRIGRKLVGDDADAALLFRAALTASPKRLVVKRHRFAPHLGKVPDIIYRGTSIRYDVYLAAMNASKT